MVPAECLAGLILIEHRSHAIRQDQYKQAVRIRLEDAPIQHVLHSSLSVTIREVRSGGQRRPVDVPQVGARPGTVSEILQRIQISVFQDRLAEPFDKTPIAPECTHVDVRHFGRRDLASRHILETGRATRACGRCQWPRYQFIVVRILFPEVRLPYGTPWRHDLNYALPPTDIAKRLCSRSEERR